MPWTHKCNAGDRQGTTPAMIGGTGLLAAGMERGSVGECLELDGLLGMRSGGRDWYTGYETTQSFSVYSPLQPTCAEFVMPLRGNVPFRVGAEGRILRKCESPKGSNSRIMRLELLTTEH